MAHPYLEQLQDLLRDVDTGDSEIICNHFFSGAAAYARGKIVASLSPKGLAFKLTETRCDEVLSNDGAVPLRYFENSPVKRGYVLFPDYRSLKNGEIERYFQECILGAEQGY